MRIARGVAAVTCAIAIALAASACSGDDDEGDDEPTEAAPTAVDRLSDIPDAILVIKPGSQGAPKTYRTAKVDSANPSASGKAVDVNFEGGPDLCSIFTGYATHETDSTIEVTVIIGEQAGCTGDPTRRTTVLNVDEPVGDRDIVISKYSQDSLPIENPSA
ncbi:hypothetical protein [Solicola gregarius]|uniref:Lipoprotein n=1 Tax=Solicola gregarius TaxID=2908642 RepID=A0AA46TI81_9ACTN|nr:hypothetical protein [Solicola gregarius]UYM04988.1 hypothetical protein L0C25_21085 [Solicola gregarius]